MFAMWMLSYTDLTRRDTNTLSYICFCVFVIATKKLLVNYCHQNRYIMKGFVCVCSYLYIFLFHSLGKGEDKEYPTIGARLIRLEDKVGTLQFVCFDCE